MHLKAEEYLQMSGENLFEKHDRPRLERASSFFERRQDELVLSCSLVALRSGLRTLRRECPQVKKTSTQCLNKRLT